VRYLVRDEPIQARRARTFILDECTADNPGFVDRIVLCELVWVFERTYRFPHDVVANTLEMILRTAQLRIEQEADVATAINDYRAGGGFANSLIATENRRNGCDYTATFDRGAARRKGFRLLR